MAKKKDDGEKVEKTEASPEATVKQPEKVEPKEESLKENPKEEKTPAKESTPAKEITPAKEQSKEISKEEPAKKEVAEEKKTTKVVKKSTKDEEYTPDLSFLPTWTKRTKKSVDELKTMLFKIVADIEKAHKEEWSSDKIWSSARARLYGSFKSDMRSSAIPYLFNTKYKSVPFDFGYKKYMEVMDVYNKDSKKAMQLGMIKIQKDVTGKKITPIPIDNAQKTKAGKPNMNRGKELPLHNWIQAIGGVAIPKDKYDKNETGFYRPAEITLSGKYADPKSHSFLGNVDLNQWYLIKVTSKTDAKNKESWQLNATSLTKWEEFTEIEDLTPAQIPEFFESFYVPLGDLADYHETYKVIDKKNLNKTGCNRLVITRAQVIDIVLSEDGKSNHKLVLDDESLGFQDVPESVTCWVSPKEQIKFGKFSEIYIFGKTSRSKRKDLSTNEYTDEWQMPSINVSGILVDELVEPEVESETAGESETQVEASAESVQVEEPDIEAQDEEKEEEPAKAKPNVKKSSKKPKEESEEEPSTEETSESEESDTEESSSEETTEESGDKKDTW